MVRHTRWIVLGIVTLVFLTSASGAVAAQDPTGEGESAGTVDIGSHDIVVRDVTVRITDLHVIGPGLPDESVDQASFTVDDATVTTNEFTVGVGDRTFQAGPLSLTLDDVGVSLEDVSTGSPDS